VELSRSFLVTIFIWTGKVAVMLSRFSRALAHFLTREDGPTAVEYAVMLALIIVVCIAAITALGTNANATFSEVSAVVGATAS
jgi:pilus assembly protein Flp/PilA